MANPEHVEVVKQGAESIKRWREANPRQQLDLSGTDWVGADLSKADLSGANLRGAKLNGAKLNYANLVGARLVGAELREADLFCSDLSDAYLMSASLYRANLVSASLPNAHASEATFSFAELTAVDLTRASLRGAQFNDANLSGATLVGADLTRAKLYNACLNRADLSQTDLAGAGLHWASLVSTRLGDANLKDAGFNGTNIDTSLAGVLGLDETRHLGPSNLSIRALLSFNEELPKRFLRGCGLSDEDTAYFRSRVGSPIRFYSCFISYSSADEEFASRLHNDFQDAGIRCWKWDHDARTGESIWDEIDEAIRVHDKLVLIASVSSLKSPAVGREVERALQREDEREKQKHAGELEGNPNVLFPVRLDDYLLREWKHGRRADVVKKVIADARGWDKDPEVYARVRDRLIRDLKPG